MRTPFNLCLRLALCGLCGPALAAAPTLLKDIRQTPGPAVEAATPATFAALGNLRLFANDNGVSGQELWVTDGTAPGTQLLKDLVPGPSGSSPRLFQVVNGVAYFRATDHRGTELWRSDGTAAGTAFLADICPGSCSSAPTSLVNLGNNRVLFFANDGVHGRQLWRSDGTAGGTVLLLSVGSGTLGKAERIVTTANRAFFAFDDGTRGLELWVSDGTPAGTKLVKDLVPGAGTSDVADLEATSSLVYFVAHGPNDGSELWRSDGTETGTFRIKDLIPGTAGVTNAMVFHLGNEAFFMTPIGGHWTLFKTSGVAEELTQVKQLGSTPFEDPPAVEAGGKLYFTAWTGGSGVELWSSDGTTGGTGMQPEINPGAGHASPALLTALGNRVVFRANDGAHGEQVWTAGGAAAGMQALTNFAFRATGRPGMFTELGGKLAFIASEGKGTGLYQSDYTLAGTQKVASLVVSSTSSNPASFVDLSGTAYFRADDGVTGDELWKTDGTPAGTVQVADVCPGSASASPFGFVQVQGGIYFAASNCSEGRAIWQTDGTTQGTSKVAEAGSSPGLTVIGNRLVFAGKAADGDTELWVIQGGVASLLRDLFPGTQGSSPTLFTPFGTSLLFSAWPGATTGGIWRTDGTAGGTVLLKEDVALSPSGFTVVGSRAFVGSGTHQEGDVLRQDLWVTDGTPGGTSRLTGFTKGVGMATLGSTAFFGGYTAANGQELWKSDGTQAGTVLLADLVPGAGSSEIDGLISVGPRFYFTAWTPAAGRELWVSDGTAAGTAMLRDIYPGVEGGSPAALRAVGARLYFTAVTPANGRELWTTDGTAAGTVMLKDANPGPADGASSALRGLTTPEVLVFAAQTPGEGEELWVSDGSPARTRRLTDLRPGPSSSAPRVFLPLGSSLVFTADDGTHDTELFSFPLSALKEVEPFTLTCPLSMTVLTQNTVGATVTYPAATVMGGSNVTLSYSTASGSTFPLGSTPVTVKGTDANGLTADCVFYVEVLPLMPDADGGVADGGLPDAGLPDGGSQPGTDGGGSGMTTRDGGTAGEVPPDGEKTGGCSAATGACGPALWLTFSLLRRRRRDAEI